MIVASFLFFLGLFLLVGFTARLHSRHTHRDYLLSNQDTAPWLAGLSAGATCNSGFMFTGLIGFSYLVGLPTFWLVIGWTFGDYMASTIIHRRLRSATSPGRAETFVGVLSHWNNTDFRLYRHIAGFISLIFLCTYAAAQFVAGSKALHVLFGWETYVGAVIGAAIIISYCWGGGLRASIWTDALQSIIMMLSMLLLVYMAFDALGGVAAAWERLEAVSPTHMDWFQPDLPFGAWGPVLFAGGWFIGGFCTPGQPHIMVRFMALDDVKNINKARAYYYGWSLTFNCVAMAVGLMTRVLLPPDVLFDAELALATISVDLLPPVLVGIVLAGIFAATISTADSLILSSAANLTDDLVPSDRLPLIVVRTGTVIITLIALGIALSGSKSVFSLVIMAWSVMGSVFTPLLLVYSLGGRPNQALVIAMALSGAVFVLLWLTVPQLGRFYEGLGGFATGLLVYFVGRMLGMTLSEEETAHPVYEHDPGAHHA